MAEIVWTKCARDGAGELAEVERVVAQLLDTRHPGNIGVSGLSTSVPLGS